MLPLRLGDPPRREPAAEALATDILANLEVLEEGDRVGPAADRAVLDECRGHPDEAVDTRGFRDDAVQGRMLGEQGLVDVVAVVRGHRDGRRLRLFAEQRVERRSVGRFHRAQHEVGHRRTRI